MYIYNIVSADTTSSLDDTYDVDTNPSTTKLPIDAAGFPRFVNESTHTTSTPPAELDMSAYEMQ